MYIYVSDLNTLDDALVLSKDAHQHLKALRVREGDPITLFDGNGQTLSVQLKQMEKRYAVVSIVSKPQIEANEQHARLVMGIPKLPTLEFVLQKATEIGVAEIVLLNSEYTPIAFDEALFQRKLPRWQKLLIAACEQSKRSHIPKLTFSSIDAYRKSKNPRYICHVDAKDSILKFPLRGPLDLVVGPEGGLSDNDLEALGGHYVRLSDGILRMETACIAALMAIKLKGL